MLDRAFRWRLALMGSGILLAIFMWAGGVFESKKAIIIDYGMLGEDALGAEVFIDDELAGQLEALHAPNRTGFEVSEGAHVVRVVHPDYGTGETRVETQASMTAVVLRLDVTEFYDESTGELEPRIVFDW